VQIKTAAELRDAFDPVKVRAETGQIYLSPCVKVTRQFLCSTELSARVKNPDVK
jgi:hypothetical protein